MPDKPTSVLASLVAETMGEKQTAARQLTPVVGEGRTPTFPSDLPGAFMSKEKMQDIAKDLRRHGATLLEIADALDIESGFDSRPERPVDLEAKRKEKEAAADERAAATAHLLTDPIKPFDARLAKLAADAQEATFKPPVETADGWKCPTHGKAIDKTSPKSGRVYRGCPDCNLFER